MGLSPQPLTHHEILIIKYIEGKNNMKTLQDYEVQTTRTELDVTVRELQRLVKTGDVSLTKDGLDALFAAILEDLSGNTQKPLENQMTL